MSNLYRKTIEIEEFFLTLLRWQKTPHSFRWKSAAEEIQGMEKKMPKEWLWPVPSCRKVINTHVPQKNSLKAYLEFVRTGMDEAEDEGTTLRRRIS